MPNFRLDRRTVLKGAAGVAIALPWLEIMRARRSARAAAVTPARRFLAVYTPGGTVLDRWRPTGTETAFTLGPILAPLEPVRSHVMVVGGLDMKSAVGEQSQAGMIAWLTGTPQVLATPSGYGSGPSIDQVLARRLSVGKARASVQMAVRWGTGKGHGLVRPTDIVNFEDAPGFPPIPPELDPAAIWQGLFGAAPPTSEWDKSMLDFVGRRYTSLATRLGAEDRRRLDEHLTRLRDLEVRLGTVVRCTPPERADTSGYDPRAGLMSSDDGSVVSPATDAAIPAVGKLMMDMLVMAFACDLTGVGTMQWSDSEAKHTLPWLGLPQTHYFYENGGGYQPVQLEKIYSWYAGQHAYLIQQMAAVDMGGHSLLDESVIFFGSEVQNPADHTKTDMPFLLAGRGGGLRPGRWVTYAHRSHNDLLVSLLNLFGDTRTTFGDPRYCAGPVPNLT